MEIETNKFCEKIISEKNIIEQKFKSVSSKETYSKADSLLMKLKYLKFKSMIQEQEMIPENSEDKGGKKVLNTSMLGSLSPLKSKNKGKKQKVALSEEQIEFKNKNHQALLQQIDTYDFVIKFYIIIYSLKNY